MKKGFVLFLAAVVLFCVSCGQDNVMQHSIDGGENAVATTRADVSATEDIGDVTEDTDNSTEVNGTEAVITEILTDVTDLEEAGDDGYGEEEQEEEPEYSYDPETVSEKAKKLNRTADAIRDEIGGFLLKSVFGGYGMTLGGEGTFMSICIEDGLWMISVDDTDYFNSTEEMEWFGYGEADSSTDKADAEDPDTLLAIALVKKFPEIKNGSAGVWLQGGSCKAAYFTEDTTAGDGQLDFMLGEGGWTAKTCEWDGYNQGISDEGNIVGTSPVLKFAVEE